MDKYRGFSSVDVLFWALPIRLTSKIEFRFSWLKNLKACFS